MELEIQRATGEIDRRRLSRRQPLSVGRHHSSDVCIDEEGVAVLHCRISWNGRTYEVAAAAPDGVDLNGTLVRNAALNDGDVLRVGTVDLQIVQEGRPVRRPHRAPAEAGTVLPSASGGEVELKPVSFDELPVTQRLPPSTSPPADRRPTESGSTAGPSSRVPARPHVEPEMPPEMLEDVDYADAEHAAAIVSCGTAAAKEPVTAPRGLARWQSKPVRPGEQDPLRSPLVIGLSIGAALLLLAGIVFWFMIGRAAAQQSYEAALADLGQGKYTQAMARFEQFLDEHPRHALAEAARAGLGKARIEKQISGSSPSWPQGLAELQSFLSLHRDRSDFGSLQGVVADYGERIALGASAAAERTRRRELLGTAGEAALIAERFSPDDKRRAAFVRKFRPALRGAEAAVLKQEVFETALDDIAAALAQRQISPAITARENLLARYPEFAANEHLGKLLTETLELEASQVRREELARPALVDAPTSSLPPPLSLTFHTRTRSDEPTENRVVFALAKDCCYGIDTVTGDPRWRRVIGGDSPFFPVEVSASTAAVLVYSTRRGELELLDRLTGELIWRQPIRERLSGPPLVAEGQIFLPTLAGQLYQIDLETGEASARLVFSQGLLGPPVVVPEGDRLVVVGDAGLIYTLSLRPLACESAAYLGHRPGSIRTPPLRLGSLLLVCENDRQEGSRLRVLDLRPGREWLAEVGSARLEGHIRETPVLRGRQLFVTSTPERIAAFTVSDDPQQPVLSLLAKYQAPTPAPGPMYLSAGPDGQLWMAGSALRRFQVTTDSIRPESEQLAGGLTAQPLQQIGSNLFAGRSTLYSAAVMLTQIDRDRMAGNWRTVVGSSVIAQAAAADHSLISLTENGELFRITSSELQRGGFKHEATLLKLSTSLSQPLSAARLAKGRIVVHSSGDQPRLRLIGPQGQVERQFALPQPLEADPVEIAAGLVLPLPGRLRLSRPADSGPVEDYIVPIGQKPSARWRHLAALSDDELLAVDDRSRLVRVQYRESPLPHLAEVARELLDAAVDVPPIVQDDDLLLADASGRLRLIKPASFETVSEIALPDPAVGRLWPMENRIYLQTGRDVLAAVEVGSELQTLWSLPIGDGGLAGEPLLHNDRLIVATGGGDVLAIDPNSGAVEVRVAIGQPLTSGPVEFGPHLIVASSDGSWHRIETVIMQSEEGGEQK